MLHAIIHSDTLDGLRYEAAIELLGPPTHSTRPLSKILYDAYDTKPDVRGDHFHGGLSVYFHPVDSTVIDARVLPPYRWE